MSDFHGFLFLLISLHHKQRHNCSCRVIPGYALMLAASRISPAFLSVCSDFFQVLIAKCRFPSQKTLLQTYACKSFSSPLNHPRCDVKPHLQVSAVCCFHFSSLHFFLAPFSPYSEYKIGPPPANPLGSRPRGRRLAGVFFTSLPVAFSKVFCFCIFPRRQRSGDIPFRLCKSAMYCFLIFFPWPLGSPSFFWKFPLVRNPFVHQGM